MAEFQGDGHEGLRDLPGQGPFGAQEEVLHQLLGDGAAALGCLAVEQVVDEGPGDGGDIHADMPLEVPVFHGQQCPDQEFRHLVEPERNPVLIGPELERADGLRLQGDAAEAGAVDVPVHGAQPAVLKRQAHRPGRLGAAGCRVGIKVHPVARQHVAAGTLNAFRPAVSAVFEQGQHLLGRLPQERRQLGRPRVEERRPGMRAVTEIQLHLVVKVQQEAGKTGRKRERDPQGKGTEKRNPAPPSRSGVGAVGAPLASGRQCPQKLRPQCQQISKPAGLVSPHWPHREGGPDRFSARDRSSISTSRLARAASASRRTQTSGPITGSSPRAPTAFS